MPRLASATRWLFDAEQGPRDRMAPRWLFLRALGGIYFSAFFSLVFQIRGLIGPDGILPANEYLRAVVHSLGYGRGLWFAPTLSLAFERPAYAHRLVLGRHDCVVTAGRECMAARNAGDLFRLLPFFCEHRAGFLQLPVGRDAARSGIHRPLLCSARIPPWLGSDVTAIARQSISAAMGMVPHLLRIRCGKDYRRRSRMAPLHRHGRVLSKWSSAYVDRLVRATPAALVSRRICLCHASTRVSPGLDVISSAPLAHRLFFDCHSLGTGNHSYCQLHISKLPRSVFRISFAG